jgi:hypothetical protein
MRYRDTTPLPRASGLCIRGLAGVDAELAIVWIVAPPFVVRAGGAGGFRLLGGGAGAARRVRGAGELGSDDALATDEDADRGESARRCCGSSSSGTGSVGENGDAMIISGGSCDSGEMGSMMGIGSE